MHCLNVGPQDLSHVTGGSTGAQYCTCRSKTDLNAIKAERCPAVNSAMAEQAEPSRMKVEK
jgi:hypothetical protein